MKTNKGFYAVMISIWGAIAVIFAAIFIYMLTGHGFGSWNWSFDWGNGGGNYTQIKSASADVSTISDIKIKASSADVNFTHTSGDKITVSIEGYGKNNDADHYSISTNGGELSVTQNINTTFWFFNLNSFGTRINIALPDSYSKDLDINDTSGDLSFSGDYTFNNVDIKQTSGDLKSDNLKSTNFYVGQTSGNCRITKLDTQKFSFNNVSGDYNISSLSGYGSISTVSGNISAAFTSMNGSCNFSTTSGNLRIGLDKSIAASVNASSVSGDIDSDYPLEYSGHGHNKATGTIGEGSGSNISISTVSGDVSITKN